MFKKLSLIIAIFFMLLSCTSLDTRQLSLVEKNQLKSSLENFENSLKKNSVDDVITFFDDTIKNRYVINNLRETNFREVKIFYSAPIFEGTSARNTVAFSFGDRTVYYMLTYKFIQDRWLITNIKAK